MSPKFSLSKESSGSFFPRPFEKFCEGNPGEKGDTTEEWTYCLHALGLSLKGLATNESPLIRMWQRRSKLRAKDPMVKKKFDRSLNSSEKNELCHQSILISRNEIRSTRACAMKRATPTIVHFKDSSQAAPATPPTALPITLPKAGHMGNTT